MAKSFPENLNILSELTTADLQELLEAELESDLAPDVERVKAIVEVLDRRRTAQAANVEASWRSFEADHLPVEPLYDSSENNKTFLSCYTNNSKKTKRRRRFTRAAIAAALVAAFLLGTVSAAAFGGRLKNTTVLWNLDTFTFGYGHPEKEHIRENEELAPLREMMDSSGLRENVVPNYLPEGYVQTALQAEDGRYRAEYSDGTDTITVIYKKVVNGGNTSFPRDDAVPEVYSAGGIQHFISTSDGKYFAAWTNDGYGCLISGVTDKAELEKMVESVYMEIGG